MKLTNIDQECYLCRQFTPYHWLKIVNFGTIRFVFQRRTFWCITLPSSSKFNFQHSHCASVSSASRVLMRMGGIYIESSVNDKSFEALHVYLLHRVHEKRWKIWNKNEQKLIKSVIFVFSFLLNHWSNIVNFGTIRFVFQRRTFWCITLPCSSKFNFQHSLWASVSSPSRVLMGMGGISIEASINDKKFWGIVHISIRSGSWKRWKIWNEVDKYWSRVLYLSSVFSSTIGRR